jgi:hypothetical protein
VTLEELARRVPGFAALNHAEKIKHFIWWLHTYGSKPTARFPALDPPDFLI